MSRFLVVLTAVILTACGGGGGMSEPESQPTPTPAPTPAPTGVYEMDDNCPTHIKGAFLDVSQAPGPGEQYIG